MANFIILTRISMSTSPDSPCTVNVDSIQTFERCDETEGTEGYTQTAITFNNGSVCRFNECKDYIDEMISRLGPDAIL